MVSRVSKSAVFSRTCDAMWLLLLLLSLFEPAVVGSCFMVVKFSLRKCSRSNSRPTRLSTPSPCALEFVFVFRLYLASNWVPTSDPDPSSIELDRCGTSSKFSSKGKLEGILAMGKVNWFLRGVHGKVSVFVLVAHWVVLRVRESAASKWANTSIDDASDCAVVVASVREDSVVTCVAVGLELELGWVVVVVVIILDLLSCSLSSMLS